MRSLLFSSVRFAVVMVAGVAGADGQDKAPSPRDRFLAEYPGAAARLRDRFLHVSGQGYLIEAQGQVENRYTVDFWFDGNRRKCHVVSDMDIPGMPKGQELSPAINDRYLFVLKRDAAKGTPYAISHVGHQNPEAVGEQNVPGLINDYAGRFLLAPLGLDVPFDELMKQDRFKITKVTEVEGGLIQVEFVHRPGDGRTAYAESVGLRFSADSAEGSHRFDPALGWALRDGKVKVQFRHGNGTLDKSVQATYSAGTGGPELTETVSKWQLKGHGEATGAFRVASATHGKIPESTFLLASYGLGDIDPSPDLATRFFRYLPYALGVLAIVGVIVFFARRREKVA